MRDYNLTKAIIFFIQQKIKETWWLWWIVGNLLFSVFVIPETNCIGCSPTQNFWMDQILLHVICFPFFLLATELLLVRAFIIVQDNIYWWYLDFISWIQNNWEKAKERAKTK